MTGRSSCSTLQTGLRVTELITLSCGDIALGAGAHVRCMGKGRKERATPIRKDSVKVLRDWLVERRRRRRTSRCSSATAVRGSAATPSSASCART